jgi:hypothetical protein
MATKKNQEIYTLSNGMKVKLNKVSPTLIQKAMNSVEMPDRPTYEASTLSGRVEVHYLDEVSAQDDPKDMGQWRAYREALEGKQGEQNQRVMNAIFLKGTSFDLPKDDEWLEDLEIIGIIDDIPRRESERKLLYLQTQTDQEDLVELLTSIMKLTGVDEEVIQEMEDSFPDPVRDES